jgi:hypothetical protein
MKAEYRRLHNEWDSYIVGLLFTAFRYMNSFGIERGVYSVWDRKGIEIDRSV